MKRQPRRKPRITLSPITRADAPVLFNWINDRELVLLSSAYRPVHETSHLEWMKGLSKRQDAVIFAIRLKRRGRRLIGVCQLNSINHANRSAELQIRIGDARSRGRGFGTEAVEMLTAFAFKDMNLHRVSLQVFSTNARAIRTYERAGFQLEATLRDAVYIDGRFVDVLIMARLEGGAAV